MAIKKLFKAPNNISLKGSLHLPGDKSIGIRSLIILSQSYGISNVSNILKVRMFKLPWTILEN